MSKSKFGFGKKDEKSEIEAAIESTADRNAAAIEKAKLLLHSKECKDFLQEYKDAERTIIDVLIKYSKEELDPLKFGNGARVILLQLVNLRTLVDRVHNKAGERYKDV